MITKTINSTEHFIALGYCNCGVYLGEYNLDYMFEKHIEQEQAAAAARVGDFATMSIAGDSYPVEIIARTAKTITVRDAAVVRASGNKYRDGAETGTFTVLPKENGRVHTFRRSAKSGRYVYAQSFFLSFGPVVDRFDPTV